MMIAAGGLYELDKRMDSDFLEIGAFLIGFGGFFVVVCALV